MSYSDSTRIRPQDTDGKIMIGPDSIFILEKHANNYNLIIEFPDGKTEKYIFKADTEYVIKYNKDQTNNDARHLIGITQHITTEFV